MQSSVIAGDWAGLVANREDLADLELESVLQGVGRGVSQPVQILGSDTRKYWLKLPSSPQGDRVPITEQIVSRVGALISAPVCVAHRVKVPRALAGVLLPNGQHLPDGIVHGSLDVPNCQEIRPDLRQYREDDSNRRRHAYLFALGDWCWGQDYQWLVKTDANNMYFSHDHGFYLPPGGSRWNAESLIEHVDDPHMLPAATDGLDREAIDDVASRLRSVTRQDIADALNMVPKSWPVTDNELETLGYFLERRAPEVAKRMEEIGK